MAVAKNLVNHAVWGITPVEFTSTTSSPLFVLLLSFVYKLFGVNLYAPAILGWFFGLAAIYVGTGFSSRYLRPLWQTITMVAVVLFTPMFLLGTLGMEHGLHVLAVLLFLASFQSEEQPLWLLALVTMLMCAARYEGLLMVGAAAVVLSLERRWRRGATTVLSACLPIGCYAWFSLTHGGAWLPNSVLLKGVHCGKTSWQGTLLILWQSTWRNLVRAPHTALMSVAMLLIAAALWKGKRQLAGLLAVNGGAGMLHLTFAAVGWAFRYEAYLMASGLIVLACAWPEVRLSKSKVLETAKVLLALAFVAVLFRATFCAAMLPLYSRAIYEQQAQMARFIKTYYQGGSIAANDIGYLAYENDLPILDLTGLASGEVFQAKRDGRDTTKFLEDTARAHKVEIVIAYDSWFSDVRYIPLGGPKLPASWQRVGRWSLPERLQLGDATVSFFGTDPRSSDLLKRHLADFAVTLPKRVSTSN